MKTSELHDGMHVEARFSRRDTEDGCSPDWSEWQVVTLYVHRREKALKTRKGQRRYRHYEAGAILTMTVKEKNWAEYCEDDYSEEHDEWLAEEYRMELRPIGKN